MILTGKAKCDFIEYIDSDDLLVEGMSDVYRNALIVEWFDSLVLWEQEFYNVYIESTPTTEFKQIIERTIINLNKKYNKGIK